MGARPIIYKYPLDLTGHNPNNLVLGEPHTLPDGVNRAVVPNYGAFFAESLRIREKETGRVLVPREDFKAVQLYQEATQKTGLEVCAALVVTNESISKDIEIDYQAIGGQFSYSVIGLRKMLEDLDIDNRPVRWGDMIGRPSEFPPAPHLHDAGDLYGFEYLVEAIDALRHAIMVGQEAALEELRQYIHLIEEDTRTRITDFFRDTTKTIEEFDARNEAFEKATTERVENFEDGVDQRVTQFEQSTTSRVENFESGMEERMGVVEERTERGSLRTFFAEWMDEEYLRTHSFDPQAHRVTKYDIGLSQIKDNPPMTVGDGFGDLTPHVNKWMKRWLKDHEKTQDPHEVQAEQVGLGELDQATPYTLTQATVDTDKHLGY
tara:strand:- start:4040 stop:5173 length:1134 start_codon:yes stop_codon:yes gene_type:complete